MKMDGKMKMDMDGDDRYSGMEMGMGYLTVHLTTADSALPVPGAKINIYDMEGNLIDTVFTDQSGLSEQVGLPAPPWQTQFDPDLPVRPYSRYIVEIIAEGFNTTVINGVQVFDESGSTLPIDLHPVSPDEIPHVEEFDIGENALEMPGTYRNKEYAPPMFAPFIHREVFIPTHITVHLGVPASNARNITVRFIDYVKNVASSEIFPDWPYHSLRANIHAQISLALNRVFTEWYRGKGYNFDITNSTQYDQYFIENRNIFDSVSSIADEIFNTYIIRPPGIEPFFAEYCDGRIASCPGMKQWGTVTLAEQGRNYLQILQYYYGSSIHIASTNNIRTPFESFQGSLTLGSSGDTVAVIQSQLARIRRNYPLIPALPVDGTYGSQTVAAVRQFQQIFGLPQTGTVDRRTWYQISNIYAAVMKLGELGSEGHRPPVITPPTTPPPANNPPYPGTPLRIGSTGSNVVLMQQFLNKIRTVYPSIPALTADGVFGPATQAAVIAFQRQFGLTADGIIGPVTWQRIVNEYNRINAGGGGSTQPGTPPPYPGTPLRVGSVGDSVLILQQNLNRVAAANPAIPRVTPDGIFGALTQASVIAFQKYYGLTPDGVVGPATWNRLMQLEV